MNTATGIRTQDSLLGLLSYLFGLSHMALTWQDEDSFRVWASKKRRINYLINSRILEYVGLTSFSVPGIRTEQAREYTYEVLVDIMHRHFRNRHRLYRPEAKIPREKFVAKAIRQCLLAEMIACLKSAGRLLKARRVDVGSHNEVSEVDVAYQFPEHAFSISELASKPDVDPAVYASFGEFHQRESGKPILAVDTYSRPSRKYENGALTKISQVKTVVTAYALPRFNLIYTARSLAAFLLLLVILPVQTIMTGVPFLILLNRLRKEALSSAFIDLMRWLEKNAISVNRIYVIPLNDLGHLRYIPSLATKLVTFNYSQNIYIYPNQSFFSEQNYAHGTLPEALPDVSLKSLLYTGKNVGYTGLVRNIKSLKKDINDTYGEIFPDTGSLDCPEKPVFLGFEEDQETTQSTGVFRIGVYELPPETRAAQYARSACGDPICDFRNIHDFLADVGELCEQGYTVVYKPKYSLTNYTAAYRELVEEMADKYGDRFSVINPYSHALQGMKQLSFTVCMPYTSTYYVARALGIPAVYYLPKNLSDTSTGADGNIVFGLGALQKELQSTPLPGFQTLQGA